MVGVPVGHGAYPTGTRYVPHWDTVRTPLGHGAYPTGTRCVPHWDTVRTPVGHGTYPSGTRYVPHWDTVRNPLGHGGCPVVSRGFSLSHAADTSVPHSVPLATIRLPVRRTLVAQDEPYRTGNLTVGAANYALRQSGHPRIPRIPLLRFCIDDVHRRSRCGGWDGASLERMD